MKNILNRSFFKKKIDKFTAIQYEKGNAIMSSIFKIIEGENTQLVFWYGYDYQILIDDRIYSLPTDVPGNPEMETIKNIVRIFNSDQRHKMNSNEGPFIYCIGEPISAYLISEDIRKEIEKKSNDQNYKIIYKAPELSQKAKEDQKFINDLDYLSEIARDSKKYNL
jgi:hypothetical protein